MTACVLAPVLAATAPSTYILLVAHSARFNSLEPLFPSIVGATRATRGLVALAGGAFTGAIGGLVVSAVTGWTWLTDACIMVSALSSGVQALARWAHCNGRKALVTMSDRVAGNVSDHGSIPL